MSSPDASQIRLRGIRQNNLKNLDLDLPLGKLIVVTGLSGAGKSSLVFDTLHAEGQRRYVETFSPYTRQFMEMMDRPQVDSIENIRPSIAIEQRNTVRTSRSTVGTMTELTDYFKVWFSHAAALYDPATGKRIEDDHPASMWGKALAAHSGERLLLTFRVHRAGKLKWKEVLASLTGQGYTRVLGPDGVRKVEALDPRKLAPGEILQVVQDRVTLAPNQRSRFLESARTALHYGGGELFLFDETGTLREHFSEGLRSPSTGETYRPATPNLFSFNSPLGACPDCRGFGRVIEIDERLVIPDHTLTIQQGVIRAFQGAVYSESQRDLIRSCRKHGIPTNIPWRDLPGEARTFVLEGEAGYGTDGREWPRAWYGVHRFFEWLQANTYKMHVRVFLSKYRAYVTCPTCGGTRLKPEALAWKWQGHSLPELYELPVATLLDLLGEVRGDTGHPESRGHDLAIEAILTRLGYLDQVGLGYLTLNRSSRSLSGGETQRVNLTSCLGTSLVDALFVLDEPSIGLHPRDIDRLVRILRRLAEQGNTVVVVEHDESIMRAADVVLEIGPEPGHQGGHLIFQGPLSDMLDARNSITGAYLSGRQTIPLPPARRSVESNGASRWLRFRGVHKHNLRDRDIDIPLDRFVVLSGVSGSGKSTLLDNVIYQGLLARSGKSSDDPASIRELEAPAIGEIVLVDQTPASRTPRSNPALFVDAWDSVRQLFLQTEDAQAAGLTISHFSFNSGHGRCDHCDGLGYERIEMQFMADVFVVCPVCEGKRFRQEILDIRWNGKNVSEILALTVNEALLFFGAVPKIKHRLEALQAVGLDYLPLGQPLNTLSGGESQRLKLVKYLGSFARPGEHALILLDEPTTGLHRHDIRRLLAVLQELVQTGHSVVVIEHQLDVLKSADWLIELGPGAGENGGEVVFAGPPEAILVTDTATRPFLGPELNGEIHALAGEAEPGDPAVAEPAAGYLAPAPLQALEIVGAREHNLRNLSVAIPHREMTVVTGVSGSGKSTLAFDIVFAEGQRRFMESMSPWARQYVEQLPRPDLDRLSGIPPTVAIEQRVNRGTRKSTVATITEVAQYLRLLYARLGVQHSPATGEPLVALSPTALLRRLQDSLRDLRDARQPVAYLCAPLIRGRKGHHQPLATWAERQGYRLLRCDGVLTPVNSFEKLDRYREHDVEVAVAHFAFNGKPAKDHRTEIKGETSTVAVALELALKLGKGACFLVDANGRLLSWFSTTRTDPATGESFPELDPKHFSWNSVRGWCPACRGHGTLYSWMQEDDRYDALPLQFADGENCPVCAGGRLSAVSQAVYLHTRSGQRYNLPDLLALPPARLLRTLDALALDRRGQAIVKDLVPEIRERLKFMDEVGLGYLTLARSTDTLSGGESQRIRLAAQLGSNLSGVLYVLDEPSIGLHARDNARLLDSLAQLRGKGNTLLVVEHAAETMRRADRVLDLGPGAGVHGGRILALGTVDELMSHPDSLTGRYLRGGIEHPLRGGRRPLPLPYHPRRKTAPDDWLVLDQPRLRNLKGGRLTLPKGRLIMVCGISGAGKSTLVRNMLVPIVKRSIRLKRDRLRGTDWPGLPFKELRFGNSFRHVIEVDQSPIGKTPRSTPATYIGAFEIIRQYFGQLPEARMHGYTPSTFSFNTKGGRCEACKGAGRVKLEMNFMPDTYVRCDDCGGKRYGAELLDLRWNNKNIAEVLAMTFEEAAEFFSFHSRLSAMLTLMVETGLGYLTLGQSSPTLSGGEAQRLKLVSELTKGLPTLEDRKRGQTAANLYVLEEPTIGLHLADCERLIELLHRLVDQGHTVVVIEHHLDLVAEADYVVEMGPEGGDAGGTILFQGTVDELVNRKDSPTAPFLREVLSLPE